MIKKTIILTCLVCLVSCYRYSEQTTPTLSGEYIIDRITVTETESIGSPNDSIYNPGDLFIDKTSRMPLDIILVGSTRWHFDYSCVSFNPNHTNTGQVVWSEKYFYDLTPGFTQFDFGYVEFNLNGYVIVFKILEDGLESLTFRTTGQWNDNNYSLSEKFVTIQLTRVGP